MIIGKGEGVFLEEPEPRPDAGQVLCKPLSVGLCGTDKLIFSGEMPAVEYPRVPCHEVSAMVIDDNSSRGLRLGTAVCIDPYNAAVVALTFGLRGLSTSVVRLATEKSALRDFFHQRGLPMPQGVAVSNQEELPEKLTFPVVVKPDLPLVGKKAVRLVRERTDLDLRLYRATRRFRLICSF